MPRQGQCINLDCDKYKVVVTIPDGQPFICVDPPGCGKDLQAVAVKPPPPVPWKIILSALGALALVAILLAVFLPKGPDKKGTDVKPTVVTNPTPTVPPSGSVKGGPPTAEIPALKTEFLMFYEKSAQKWIEDTAEEVNKNSKGAGKITVDYRGSKEGKDDILYRRAQPVVWNPANLYWTDKLNVDWTNPKVGKQTDKVIDANQVKVILTTRIVLIMRDDRASVFESAMQTPHYRGRTWELLFDAATKGWKAIGGELEWGKLKLVHTKPTLSNSGMLSLALMFDEYKIRNPTATPDSSGFLNFMRGIEDAVVEFPDTTTNAFKRFSESGPNRPDVVIAYEQNAIGKIDEDEKIHIVYPSPTVAVNFPATVLSAPWVKPEQAADGQAFINYLLTPEVQKRAVQYGFRPGITSLHTEVDAKLDTTPHRNAGFRMTATLEEQPADFPTIDSLIYQWYQAYGTRR